MEKSSSREEVSSGDSGLATPREVDSLPVFEEINKDQTSNVREQPGPTETMTMPVVGQTKLTKDERTLIIEKFVPKYSEVEVEEAVRLENEKHKEIIDEKRKKLQDLQGIQL